MVSTRMVEISDVACMWVLSALTHLPANCCVASGNPNHIGRFTR